MPIGNGAVLIGMSERSQGRMIEQIAKALFAKGAADRVIACVMTKDRAHMHLDTVFTLLDRDKATAFPKVVGNIRAISLRPGDGDGFHVTVEDDFIGAVANALGVPKLHVVETGGDQYQQEREQWDDGNNVVALEPGVVVAYERNTYTIAKMRQAGVEVVDDRGLRARQGPRRRALHDLSAAAGSDLGATPWLAETNTSRWVSAPSWRSPSSPCSPGPATTLASTTATVIRRTSPKSSPTARPSRRKATPSPPTATLPLRRRRHLGVSSMDDTSGEKVSGPRPPSFLDALAPVLVLIGLLTLTIVLFGTAAADGPLQVALFTSAVFAGLVAFKNGYTAATLREAAIGGISSAMGALFILLAVGALIGTWNMAGTIPTVVSYGIAILKPAIFYAAVALICAVVGAVTGSSWTTAGTLGVAFIGMAPILGLSTTIAAGAIISGAYMGDKMSPLSETTVLVPSLVGGVTVNEHIRGMLWTVVPSFVLAFVVFVVIGVVDDPASSAVGTDAARDVLATAFNISPVNLLPLVVLIAVTLWRVPPFLAIYAVALFSGILACFTQRDAVEAFVDEPGQGTLLTSIEAIYQSMATGFVSASGNETIDALFSRGGMASMLTTVWLILGAMCFAAIMEEAGFLNRLIAPLVRVAHSDRALISSVAGTAIGLNVVAGDQYVADVLPSRVYRAEFARRGLAPRMLSRTVEDTGTVTSPLVPWNSCGAYMTGVLGVPTIEYLPFAFFNLFNPFIALAYAFTGFRIERLPPADAPVIDGNGAVPRWRNDFLHSLPKETVMSNDVQATGDGAVDGRTCR